MSRLVAFALLLTAAGLVAAQPKSEPTHDGKALSEWVKLLNSDDAGARGKAEAAVRALAGHPDEVTEALLVAIAEPGTDSSAHLRVLQRLGPRAVPALTAALWSDRLWESRLAAALLARLGGDARPAASALVRVLAHSEVLRRPAAAAALGAIGAESAIPALTKLLDDSDTDVRLRAAAALVAAGGDPAVAVPVLRDLVDSKSRGLALAAAEELGELGPEAAPAVPSIAAALPKAPAEDVSRYVAVLGRIGPPAKEAVPAIKAAAKAEQWLLRAEAAVALWRIARDPDAAKILRGELKDWLPSSAPLPEILWRIDPGADTVKALESLLKSDTLEVAIAAAGILGAKHKDAVPLLGRMLAHKEPGVRARAVVAVVRLGPAAKEVAGALRGATKDDVPQTAFWATAALCRLDPKPDAVAAVAGYLGDRDPELRRSAAEAIGQLGEAGKPASARLTAALADADGQTRLLSAVALWKVERSPTALPAAVALLKDPDPLVRGLAAVDIGGQFGADAASAVPDLVKRLFDPFSSVRSSTAEALGRIGPGAKDAAPALLALLDGDEPGFVQSAACEALGLIQPADKDAAVAVLKKKLDHPLALTRTHAALALFLLAGDKSGEKVAERGLGSRSHQVRITAAECLWRMGKDARAVPLLLRSLEEGNLDGTQRENERYMAARALGRVGTSAKSAVPELSKLLAHHDAALATVAAEAIKLIEADAKKK